MLRFFGDVDGRGSRAVSAMAGFPCWEIYRTAAKAYRLVEAYGNACEMVVLPRTRLPGTVFSEKR